MHEPTEEPAGIVVVVVTGTGGGITVVKVGTPHRLGTVSTLGSVVHESNPMPGLAVNVVGHRITAPARALAAALAPLARVLRATELDEERAKIERAAGSVLGAFVDQLGLGAVPAAVVGIGEDDGDGYCGTPWPGNPPHGGWRVVPVEVAGAVRVER